VLTLALAAAVIAEDTEVLLLKEAGVHDIEVPKDGNFSVCARALFIFMFICGYFFGFAVTFFAPFSH